MTLLRKSILLISVIMIALLITTYFITQSVLVSGFINLEEQRTQEDVQRALAAISNQVNWLKGNTSDWAFWDDTYAFAQDLNQNYIDTNLAHTTFVSLNIDAILYIDTGGKIIHGVAYDGIEEKETAVSPNLLTYVTTHKELITLSNADDGIGGIADLPEGPCLLAASPILTSGRTGPSHGTLIMVRYLNDAEVESIAGLVLFPVSIYSLTNSQLPDDFTKAKQNIPPDKQVYVMPREKNVVSGYALLNDISGQSALIMRIERPRDIYHKGQESVFITLGIVAIAGVIAGILGLIAQDTITSSRLRRLNANVREISTSGNISTRVNAIGKDEISNLAGDINKMLDTIDAHNKKETELLSSLEAEMKKRADYTRELAHELKTPLTPIMSSSELLAENLKEEPWASLAKNVYRGASDMNDRLDDLLDVAKGEVGILRLSMEDIDPTPFIHQIAEEMLPLIKHHKQKMTIDLPPDLPHIMGDEVRLRQVLRNLVNNATKFTHEEGTITIRARTDGDKLVIDIEDTGRGIDAEKLDKIFQPYVRLGDDKEHQKGLGLGLKLSKTLVELHGGQIWVKSQKGKGSIFSFSVPVSSAYEKARKQKKVR